MHTAREILFTLSYIYKGDYRSIVDAIKKKQEISEEEFSKVLNGQNKYSFITILDENYPDFLKSIYQPPIILYYYGDISLLNSHNKLTCIGTRKPSEYQKNTAYTLIKDLEKEFENKLVIVSGMAYGLDSTMMRAAINVNAPIISVLGNGIDKCYPIESDDIYEYCKNNKGLVLSEYPVDISPYPEHFIFRNRLLSAIGDCLFVAGGNNRSGTSSTVRYALEQGKEVLALPCNISGNDLTNTLIKEGAKSVLSVLDLKESLLETASHKI